MARLVARILILSGLLSFQNLSLVHAAPMGPTQVRAMANSWAARSAGFQGAQVSNVQGLSWEAAEPAFYLVTLNQGGWMLTSGDDALRPVVGYSTQGLPSGELPPALLERLQAEEREVIALRAAGGSCTVALDAWTALLQNRGAESTALSTSPGDVAPMIEALWGQGSLFNTSCPSDAAGPGGHAFVGCVGVAIAQVLDFWNWPEQGEFVQSYYHNTYGDISVDFNQEFYNWDAITPTEVNTDVKELLYHAGVSVRMNYGPSLSTAQSTMIPTALRAYFRYQDSTRMVWRSSYTAETWRTLLQSELSAGRPVIYRGQGPNGGHAFDLDGVQDSTWFHINWGWSGNYNGFFLLDDLSPGNSYFGDVQGAVIGIEPDGIVNHRPHAPAVQLEILLNETAHVVLHGTDPDGDALTYQVDGEAVDGNVWSWTPPANKRGTYLFTYKACDPSGCGPSAALTVVVQNAQHRSDVTRLETAPLPRVRDPRSTGNGTQDETADLGSPAALPAKSDLRPAYPNPFNPETTLPFDLPQAGHVRLCICNLAGERVALLLDADLEAGHHELRWSASHLASGLYLAVLETGSGASTERLHLVK